MESTSKASRDPPDAYQATEWTTASARMQRITKEIEKPRKVVDHDQFLVFSRICQIRVTANAKPSKAAPMSTFREMNDSPC